MRRGRGRSSWLVLLAGGRALERPHVLASTVVAGSRDRGLQAIAVAQHVVDLLRKVVLVVGPYPHLGSRGCADAKSSAGWIDRCELGRLGAAGPRDVDVAARSCEQCEGLGAALDLAHATE